MPFLFLCVIRISRSLVLTTDFIHALQKNLWWLFAPNCVIMLCTKYTANREEVGRHHMKHITKQLVWAALLTMFFSVIAPSALAAGSNAAASAAKPAFNMAIAYGITSAAALLLAGGYAGLVRKKNPWLLLLFISVVVVNLGYFALSISKTLGEALLANRVSYLGSVFLPLCMLMAVMDVCRVRYKKHLPIILVCLSVAVFLLAASPGYLDWYYSDVSLIFINGMAKLEKVYGPLHCVYLVYLLTYFSLMIGVILTSIVKKTVASHKHAALLLTVVFLNIAIWAVEQLVYTEFEILSVSYIVSEVLLLMLYGMMQDYGILSEGDKAPVLVSAPATPVVETPLPEPAVAVEASVDAEEETHSVLDNERILLLAEKWQQEYTLTNRETQVLIALLQNKRRKEIAVDMDVTEHTVKKHTGNIFSKLEVTSRAELFALAGQA